MIAANFDCVGRGTQLPKALGKNILTDTLGFFNLCSKVVDFLHVTQHYCIC